MAKLLGVLRRYVYKSRTSIKAILSGCLTVLGLRSLVHAFKNRVKIEQPKKVLRSSRLHAIAHSLVHLIPMAVLIWLIYLNYKGFFYGPGLSYYNSRDTLYFALYQVGAKVIELACVASLGVILLHVLRHDLLFETLIPLGLLTSPFWFTTPVSLFSPEFLTAAQITLTRWGQFCRNFGHTFRLKRADLKAVWKSSRMIILVLILVLVATLIGPAAAVLLIPRIQDFSAGAATYSLNATFEEMWPTNVSSIDELAVCSGNNATLYAVCPSGGYSSMRYQGHYNGVYSSGQWNPKLRALIDISTLSFLALDPVGIAPLLMSSGTDFRGPRSRTILTQPNLYTAIQQMVLVGDWRSAVDGMHPSVQNAVLSDSLFNVKNFYWVYSPQASGSSVHPITNVRCSLPESLTADADTVGFHFIENQPLANIYNGWSKDGVTKPVVISALDREPTSHVRTQWVALNPKDFGAVSTGLLIEMPWTPQTSDTSRLAIRCSIAASWSLGDHGNVPGSSNGAWVVDTRYESSELGKIRPILDQASPKDVLDGKYSRRVELESSWLDLLTPTAPDPPVTDDSWQPNTLENILYGAGFDSLFRELRYGTSAIGLDDGGCGYGSFSAELSDLELWNKRVCSKDDRLAYIERTVAQLVTDGLSRRLSHRAFDKLPDLRSWIPEGRTNSRNADYDLRLLRGSLDPSENAFVPPNNTNQVSQRVVFKVNGYGYRATETTDYLATLVAAVYLLVASYHVFWNILVHPVTSISWNSALELVLLAFNSAPDPSLHATSAGIGRWRTYQRLVRVRATFNQPHSGQEVDVIDAQQDPHVCLVVETAATRVSQVYMNPAADSPEAVLVPLQSISDGTDGTTMAKTPGQSHAVNIVANPAGSISISGTASSPGQHYFDVEIDKKYV